MNCRNWLPVALIVGVLLPHDSFAETWRCWYQSQAEAAIACRLVMPSTTVPVKPLWGGNAAGGPTEFSQEVILIPLFEAMNPVVMAPLRELATNVLCASRVDCGVRMISSSRLGASAVR